MIPKLNSAHGSETRNIINAAIDAINTQGKSIQDLVAEGQLTEEQYAELISVINSMLKSGEVGMQDLSSELQHELKDFSSRLAQKVNRGNVDKSDLTPEFRDEIEGFSSQLAQTDGEVNATNLRIDNLVIPISPENANVEVTDAHVSIAKNKAFSTIGDRFEDAEHHLQQVESALTSDYFFITDWEVGGFNISGAEINSDNNARSGFIKVRKNMIVSTNDDSLKGVYLFLYNNAKEYISRSEYASSQIIPQDGYARILTGFTDEEIITDVRYFKDKFVCNIRRNDGNDPIKTAVDGEYYINSWSIGTVNRTGEVIGSDSRVISDFIKVESGMYIYLDDINDLAGIYLVKYDKNKVFLGTEEYSSAHTITEDGYSRLVIKYSDDREITDISYFLDKVKLNFKKTEPEEQVIGSQYINNWFIGSINTRGEDVQENNRIRTDFIKAKKNTLIHMPDVGETKGIYLIQYDNEKKNIKQIIYADRQITIRDGYFRLITGFDDDRNITDTSFIENKVVAEKYQPYLSGNFSDYYVSDPCESVARGTSFELEFSDIDDIYTRYDALMDDYPDVITKELLGYGGDSTNTADETLPIYEYTINALSPRDNSKIEPAPKILLITGVHGDEKSTVWSTLKFVEKLLQNWTTKDNLESILSNVSLKIIPIGNPGGYNANTRNNLSDIDINRNFSYKWDEFDDPNYNKGEAPYSLLESKLIKDWMVENNDAIAFIDYHNVYESITVSYLDTPNRKLWQIYSSLLKRMSYRWFHKYDSFRTTPGEAQGFIRNDQQPMAFQEGVIQGIKNSAIIEVARDYQSEQFNAVTIERGVEVISNYILSLLDAYTKNLIN